MKLDFLTHFCFRLLRRSSFCLLVALGGRRFQDYILASLNYDFFRVDGQFGVMMIHPPVLMTQEARVEVVELTSSSFRIGRKVMLNPEKYEKCRNVEKKNISPSNRVSSLNHIGSRAVFA